MVANPIYDGGPVYETIPGTFPRQHSNSESTTMSSVPPTPTTPFPPVPVNATESPYAYAPNQIDSPYDPLPHQSHTNFSFDDSSYMVMNAVTGAGKRLSGDEETHADSDSNSARYVPEPCASLV